MKIPRGKSEISIKVFSSRFHQYRIVKEKNKISLENLALCFANTKGR